jgi:vancomycin resistance protein YoaR
MTDQTPDRPPGRDDEARPDDVTVDPETGLVVENDELDLSDEPAPEAAGAGAATEPTATEPAADEVEPSAAPEPDAEPAVSAADGPVAEADEPEPAAEADETPAAAEPDADPVPATTRRPAHGPVEDGPPAETRVAHDDDLVIPAHAVSDDWDERPGAATLSAADTGAGTGDDARSSRHWGRYALLAVVVLLGAAYVTGYFLTGTRLPASTTIGGVDVSGRSPAEARDALQAELGPRTDREIALTYGKKSFTIKPADAGLALDVDRSVDEAGGARSWDPRDMVALFVGDHDHAPALDVDEAALESSVAAISEGIDVEVVEPQITFPGGTPRARQPEAGLVVPRSDAADAIRAAYLVDDEPIEVPTVAVEPTVDADALDAAMTEIAEPAVSGPVTLKVGDTAVPLPVSAFAPALRVQVQDGALAPVLDPERLAQPLTDSTTGIGTKAVDATVEIRDGKPVVVPGKEGLGLQPEEMATALVPALTRTGDARSVEVEAKVVQPRFTTADAEALKITEKVGEFETKFPYAEYRNTNQSRGAELIDGTIVKPGETFSFNDTVGERTEANGFVTGTVINGGVFREELGGGVSQVVTTLYNAGFFGGMDDVEHHPHAFYIDRYPVGREATVYFGSLDLRFKNPTDYGVLIRAYVNKSTPGREGEMHVELWSTKVWDRIEADASPRRNGRSPGTQYDDTDRCVPQAPIAGFDIDIVRKFYRDGKVAKTETDTANYQAADRVICGKKPDPKDD